MAKNNSSMYPYNTLHKSYAIIALCCLFTLLGGAVLFFKERMLFSDAPHVLFRIINDGSLQIAEKRYGSFVTQLFPLVGAKLHLSLNALMLLYSASFNIFFLAAAFWVVYKYKRHDLAILLAFYLTLFASDTFFWTNNEIHQGITWLLIAFAVCMDMSAQKRSIALTLPMFILLFGLAIWTHPLVMLAALFLWFFYWMRGKQWPFQPNESILYSIALIALAAAKLYQGAHHGYDSGKIEFVTQLSGDHVKHLLSSPQLHSFIKGCITNYWLVVLLLMAGLASLIKEKKYLLAAYTIAGAGGYVLLLCITYWDVQGLRFYMESEYMPLGIICCAPFVYYTLPMLKRQQGMILLVLVFAVRLGYIYYSSTLFTNRVALLQNIDQHMKAQGITKAIITHVDGATDKALLMNWGAPVESMTLSQLNNETPQRTFIFADDQQLKSFNTASKDTLLGCFEKVPASKINAAYFRMDTASGYRVVEYGELMR